jgi:hypothetical protein
MPWRISLLSLTRLSAIELFFTNSVVRLKKMISRNGSMNSTTCKCQEGRRDVNHAAVTAGATRRSDVQRSPRTLRRPERRK